MNVEQAHYDFIQQHLKRRTGERKGRLARGHREAESLFCQQVWWPLQGNFEQLHPEYEVLDWRGKSYFCDFVWITPLVKLVIEIKGFGPHVREMDRQSYCYELNRETFLTAMGFHVIAFAYDDIAHRPDLCITLLRMIMSRFQASADSTLPHSLIEQEIIRLACRLARTLRPVDVESHLHVNHRTAVRSLQALCAKGVLAPITGAQGKHVVRYELKFSGFRQLMF